MQNALKMDIDGVLYNVFKQKLYITKLPDKFSFKLKCVSGLYLIFSTNKSRKKLYDLIKFWYVPQNFRI